MAEYDNNLTGVLFRNERKEKDTQPDYKGSCEVNGIEYWISGWKKQTAKGPALSMRFEVKEEKRAEPKNPQPDDTDIPF